MNCCPIHSAMPQIDNPACPVCRERKAKRERRIRRSVHRWVKAHPTPKRPPLMPAAMPAERDMHSFQLKGREGIGKIRREFRKVRGWA